MKGKKLSFRARLICLLLLCWLLPVLLIAWVNVTYVTGDRLEGRILHEIDRLEFSVDGVIDRLEQAVRLSRQASYDRVIIDRYGQYRKGEIEDRSLVSDSFYYLREKFGEDSLVQMAALWFREDPEHLYCSTYNTREGATYDQVQHYWEEDHRAVSGLSDGLDTRVGLYVNGERVYLVRNLYTQNYENAATLVFLLNREYCFQDFYPLTDEISVTLQLNDCTVQLSGQPVTAEETGLAELGGTSGYRLERGRLNIYHERRMGDQHLTALVRFDDSSAFEPLYAMNTVLAGMALCLIPLMLLLLWVFYHHVTRPIRSMMKGAREIEEGNLGYQLEFEPSSREFKYLADSFNKMSKRLDYQFRHIYKGEIALRDARIKALQAHINPHFMNNTLEIINWEARLSGNDKVSEMIEALATLMNAGIDRKQQPLIPLSEEMIYVDAYLHIVSERLGSRLTVINELPDDIMGYKVPRLILQPVIENAIEHGAARNGRGTVILYGYREGDFLYLEIMNESALTEEDEEKIRRLLDPSYDTTKEPSLNLGIANVNQRLRIIYGEDSGLSLEKIDEENVRARLKIRVSGETAQNLPLI